MFTRLLSSGLIASVFSLSLLPLNAVALPLQTDSSRGVLLAQTIYPDQDYSDSGDSPRPMTPQMRLRRSGTPQIRPTQRNSQPTQNNPRQRTDFTGTYRANVRDGNFSMAVQMQLNANGSATMRTEYPDYEPIQERGNWRALNDGSVLVIFTEMDGQAAEAYNVLGFRPGNSGQLVATVYDPDIYGTQRLTLRKDGTAQTPNADYSGTYATSIYSDDNYSMDLTLDLKRDGSAKMTTDYLDNQDPVVETGTWRTNRDGTISVVLNELDGEQQNTDNVIRFRVNNNTLVATSFDASIYGSDPFTLRKRR